jgi:hypothetical protein
MTRASILAVAILPLLTVAGCEKRSSNVPDEQADADNAPAEDFAPDEEDLEEEERAPNLGKRRPS